MRELVVVVVVVIVVIVIAIPRISRILQSGPESAVSADLAFFAGVLIFIVQNTTVNFRPKS